MRTVLSLTALGVLIVLLVDASQAQQPGRFGGGRGFGGPGFLLMNKGVQEELKITDEQKTKIAEITKEYGAKQRELFSGFQDLSNEEKRAKFKELQNDPKFKEISEGQTKAIMAVLKPEQEKRFKQLQLQQEGVRAFQNETVVKELQITDEQKEKLKTIAEENGKEMRELFSEATKDNRAEMQKKIRSLREEGMEKAVAVLNADQKSKWKELTGEPFEVRFEGFGGGGRRPGNGKDGGKKDPDKTE